MIVRGKYYEMLKSRLQSQYWSGRPQAVVQQPTLLLKELSRCVRR
jgi:hypothetical protein